MATFSTRSKSFPRCDGPWKNREFDIEFLIFEIVQLSGPWKLVNSTFFKKSAVRLLGVRLISSFSFRLVDRTATPTDENCGKRVSGRIIKILQFLFYTFKFLFTILNTFFQSRYQILEGLGRFVREN